MSSPSTITAGHGNCVAELMLSWAPARAKVVRFLQVLLFLGWSGSLASAQTVNVTATWNFNPEPDVNGYLVCRRSVTPAPGSPCPAPSATAQTYPTQTDAGNVAIKVLSLTTGSCYYFVLKAYNTSGGISNPTLPEILIDLTNQPPTLNTVSNQNSLEGASVSLQLVGSDPESNPLTYSATGLPPGLTVNPSTGLISGSLGYTSSGTYPVTASVSDGSSSASTNFTWTVINRAPGVVVANDFDGDLKSDFSAFQGPGTPSAVWFISRSGSNNTLNYNIPVGGAAADQAVPGDYDGDGRTDVAYFSSGTWTIKTSASNFASTVTYTLGSMSDRVAPGDYDGDGKTDPAVFHPTTPGQFEILTSSSGFTTHLFINNFGTSADRPVPGDFDGDLKTDVAVYKPSGQWSVLLSGSNNTITLNVTPGLGGAIPVPGDYDGDGKTDVGIYRPSNGTWSLLMSAAGFAGPPTTIISLIGEVPVPGDYEGDRKTDVATYQPLTGLWTVKTSSSNYTSTVLQTLTPHAVTDRPIPNIIIANGVMIRNDLIVDFGSSVGLYELLDGTNWAQLHTLSPNRMVAGDVDGNGIDDLVVDFGAGGTYILFNNTTWFKLHTLSPSLMATADMDGNGKDDIVLDFPGIGVWVFYNNTTWTQLHTTDVSAISVGDFDGNGKDDVLLNFPSGLYIFFNNASWSQLHSLTSTKMAVGDFDGNGKDDIVIDFGGSGLWMYSNNATWTQIHTLSVNRLTAGDLDGDGKDDLIVDFPVYGLLMLFNSVTWVQLHTLNAETITTADIDSSGKDDVIIDFGASGLWAFKNNATWIKLHSLSPEDVAAAAIR